MFTLNLVYPHSFSLHVLDERTVRVVLAFKAEGDFLFNPDVVFGYAGVFQGPSFSGKAALPCRGYPQYAAFSKSTLLNLTTAFLWLGWKDECS
jgi:hypothetical protein